MIPLSKVGALELRTRGRHPNLSWLEEYRKTVDVDGELTWVGIIPPGGQAVCALSELQLPCGAPDVTLYQFFH